MDCEVVYNGQVCPRTAKFNLATPLVASRDICATHKNTFLRAVEKFNSQNLLGQYFDIRDFSLTEL